MSKAIYLAPGPGCNSFEHLKKTLSSEQYPLSVFQRQGLYLALLLFSRSIGPVVLNVFNMTPLRKADEHREEKKNKKKTEGGKEDRLSLLLFFNSVNSPR